MVEIGVEVQVVVVVLPLLNNVFFWPRRPFLDVFPSNPNNLGGQPLER